MYVYNTAMTKQLIKSLQNNALFNYPVPGFEVYETHISWVLLTGTYAYKIKKPVNFGFLDFSTLEKRRFYCEEEVRLNQRLAPQLYIGIVPITGEASSPQLNGDGPVIEYAVKMHQFDQSTQFDRLLSKDQLTTEHIDRVADILADFHHAGVIADNARHFGTPDAVMQPVAENFTQIHPLLSDKDEINHLEHVKKWSEDTAERLAQTFQARKDQGFIRECHGDMHLANIALYHDEVVIFDCLEFNDNLRWIDVMSETAFLMMDLDEHGQHKLAFRFLNRYLQHTGDYDGLKVLRFYQVYRAMVRAKVSCLRLAQAGIKPEDKVSAQQQFHKYLTLADDYTRPSVTALMITHGLSGSGKTTITQPLLERAGAIRIRSDIERKRLHGLAAEQKSGSGIDNGMYSAAASAQTYQRLAQLAGDIIAAGYPVIVDAAFLKRDQRRLFQVITRKHNVPFVILDFQAPVELLRKWIIERAEDGHDASEADIPVLEHQLAAQEALAEEEQQFSLTIDTGHEVDINEVVKGLNKLIYATA